MARAAYLKGSSILSSPLLQYPKKKLPWFKTSIKKKKVIIERLANP